MKKMGIYLLIIFFIYLIFQLIYSGYFLYKGTKLSKTFYTQDANFGDPKNPPFKLFISGDSVAAGVGATEFKNSVAGRLASYFGQNYYVNFVNEAVVGTKMVDMLSRPVPSQKQDLIVLIVSSNDLFKFTNLAEFGKNTQKALAKYAPLANKLIIVGPGRVFDTTSIPLPMLPLYRIQAPKYASIITKEASKHSNIAHVNPLKPPEELPKYGSTLSSDRFHPNNEGHKFWFDMIKSKL